MSPARRKLLDRMIDCLPEQDQLLIFEIVKRFMPDDIATSDDIMEVREAHKEYACGETVRHEDIDWN